MGGEGSMQSMNTILRNNRSLLRKKSMFKKDRSFFESRKEYLKAAKGEIDFKKISKSDLRKIREKVIKDRESESLKGWILAFVILTPIIALIIIVSNNIISENKVQYEKTQEIILNEQFAEKYDKYDFFIDEGDKWIEKQNWNNAIYQYKNAVRQFPEKYEANYRLALGYSYNCKFQNKDCDKGKILVERLLKVNPNNSDLLILKKIMDK